MKVFTIENETNNITLHATIQDAEAVANTEQFRNEAGLANLAASWPSARLIEIWNSLPGAVPVKKFKDRATAVTHIWKSIQSLDASVPAGLASDQPDQPSEPETTVGSSEAATATEDIGESVETMSDTPLRHKRPTSRRRRLPQPTRPPGPRKRPSP